jgi:hypothetical protein
MFYGRSDLANKVVIEVFKNVSDFQINLTKNGVEGEDEDVDY